MGCCKSKDKTETNNGNNKNKDVKETFVDHNRIVIALDIGTENMGYAFSCYARKNKIYTAKNSSSQHRERMPNALLLNDDFSRNSVGFDAVKYHSNLVLKKLHPEQLYFRNFKKKRIEQEKVDSEYHITVSDEDIIYHLMEALRQNALETAHEILCCEREHLENNVDWVLITPNFAKEHVLRAAEKAKLERKEFLPESEAAAWYCLCSQLKVTCTNEITHMLRGHKFAVATLGAGETSICVFEVKSDKIFNPVFQTFYNVGGNSVNDKFEKFMEDICGLSSWNEFIIDHEYDYEYLMRSFFDEKVKVNNNSDVIVIALPKNLLVIIETNENVTLAKTIEGRQDLLAKAELIEDKLFIHRKQIEEFFVPSYQTILNMLEMIREKGASDLNEIVFVGGYSACNLIRTKLKQECHSFDIAFAPDPDMVVIKGAVMRGLAGNTS